MSKRPRPGFERLTDQGEEGEAELQLLITPAAAPGEDAPPSPVSPSRGSPSSPRMSRAAKKLGLDTRQAVHAWWKEKRARAGQPLCRIFRQPHQYDDGDETIPFRPYAVGSRAGGLRQSVRGPVAGAEGTDDKPTGRARPCYKELSNAEIMRMQKQESKMEERRRRHAMGDYSPSPKKGRKRKNADADGAAPADDEAAARRNARKAAKAAAADQKRRLKRRPKWQKQQSSTPEPLKLTAMLLKWCYQ